MISIIDYGAGNLKSVEKAVCYLGENVIVTSDADAILNTDGVILPGVGEFGDAMAALSACGLVDTVKKAADQKPFLGICLGMQLLFERSEESPGVSGLGILRGECFRIPDKGLKVPHIGWNRLDVLKDTMFKGIADNPFVYFVHSYYVKAKDKSVVSAQTDYACKIDAAVERDNLFAMQFHPEKSGQAGLLMLNNFIQYVRGKV